VVLVCYSLLFASIKMSMVKKSILGPVDNGLIVAVGGDFFVLQGRRGVA
jgi:hypothetical protein